MAISRGSKRPGRRTTGKNPLLRKDPRAEPDSSDVAARSSRPPSSPSRAPSRVPAADRLAELEAALEHERLEREKDEASMGEMLVRIAEGDRAKRNAEERSRQLAAKLEQLEAQLDALESTADANAAPKKPSVAPQRSMVDAATQSRIADLEAALTEAQKRVQEIAAQRDGFERAAHEARSGTSGKEKELRATVKELEKELEGTRENLEGIAAQLRETTAVSDALTKGAKQAVGLRNELEAQLRTASDQLRQASARRAELEKQVVEAAADCDVQTQRAKTLAAQVTDGEKQIEALAGELAKTKKLQGDLEKRADLTARDLAKRVSDVDHARAARDAIERVADQRGDAARAALQILAEISERDVAIAEERATAIAKARELLAPVRESLPPGTRAKRLGKSMAPGANVAESDVLSLDDSDLVDEER